MMSFGSARNGKIHWVNCLTKEAAAYELFELEILVRDVVGNGFDPDSLRLDLLLTMPDGTRRSHPCFLYKKAHIDANGVYSTDDEAPPVWRVRITPPLAGDYSARLCLLENSLETDAVALQFTVAPTADTRGFLRVEETVHKAFQFDNGQIFTPIGQNVCWDEKVNWKEHKSPETLDMYRTIFGKMHQYRANWSRLWLSAEWDFGFFGKNRHTDDFTDVLHRAARLDDLLKLMEENEIYCVMVLFHHGIFNDGGANTDWVNNAFNAANPHGYLREPGEFFTDPRALKETKQYLRYMVARYGYSRQIFSWELFNEVNFTAGDPDDIRRWHRTMTEELRRYDLHPHMVTTSSSVNRYPLIFDDMFDYINMHRYGDPGNPKMIVHEAYLAFHDFDRPILMEESGFDAYRPFTHYIARHQQIWVGLMANTPATAMEWFWGEWDRYTNGTDDPDYSYRDFAPAADFASLIPRRDPKQRFVSRERLALNHARADVLGYNGTDYAYLWIYDAAYTVKSPDPVEIENVTMELWLENGDYSIRWFDTYTGTFFREDNCTVRGQFLRLSPPKFEKDIAVAIQRTEPHPSHPLPNDRNGIR